MSVGGWEDPNRRLNLMCVCVCVCVCVSQAEAKKWHLIHGETRHTSTGGRRATHSDGVGGGGGGMACSGELQGAHRGTGYGAGEWEDDIPHVSHTHTHAYTHTHTRLAACCLLDTAVRWMHAA